MSSEGPSDGPMSADLVRPKTLLDNWWLYADDLSASDLRYYLRNYRYGDIRRWQEGAVDMPRRPPRLTFVGDQNTGKSSLINSLKAAWEGPRNSPLCHEHATVGSPETIGTVSFDGPFNLVDRSSPDGPRTVIELYDSKGFNLQEENKIYDVTQRTNTVIDLVKGNLQPGAKMTDHEPAMIVNRSHTPPSGKRGNKKKAEGNDDGDGDDDDNDVQQQQQQRWDGVDLFVIVAPFHRSNDIKVAGAFYTALRKNNIRVSLVLTHSGIETRSIHLGHISHNCVQNYRVKEHTDEARNAHFLRVLTDILFALERHPGGQANTSLRRRWQTVYERYAAPLADWFRSHTMAVVLCILAAVVVKIYIL